MRAAMTHHLVPYSQKRASLLETWVKKQMPLSSVSDKDIVYPTPYRGEEAVIKAGEKLYYFGC